MTPPTRAELDAALALIRAAHPDADVLRDGVADTYRVKQPDGLLIYLSARDRAVLQAGNPYVTWVVTFRGGQAVGVASFVSRACSVGNRAARSS